MVKVIDPGMLWDSRANCLSVMTALSVEDYLELVENSYRARGGIEHQRAALKTTSAKRIRSRMVSDIQSGAVLPPIVIGLVVADDELDKLKDSEPSAILDFIVSEKANSLAIIDGMQRTTALLDAATDLVHGSAVKASKVRMECWVAARTESLIYRMLVLNTGQVPWRVGKQLEVVYAPLVEEITRQVDIPKVLDNAEAERRTKAGQYKPDDIVQTYIAFGLRKTDIDTNETLADEFSRIDLTEAHTGDRYNRFFYPILDMMVQLDQAFSRLDAEFEIGDDAPSVKIGRNIFDKLTARIGFVVAMTVSVLGRPGITRDDDEAEKAIETRKSQVSGFIERLSKLDASELQAFLKLDLLAERLDGQKRAAVGRHERAFFDNAFKALIEEGFEVDDLEPCWRA